MTTNSINFAEVEAKLLASNVSVPPNVEAYRKTLSSLRAQGKFDEANRFKAVSFGILYGVKHDQTSK